MESGKKWAAFLVVTVGVLMSTLDGSMVNIALPKIMGEFNVPLTMVEWVVVLYLLTITASLLTFGRLADIFGLMPVNTIGLVAFTLASALCGLAKSSGQLILFRGFQGLGASMIMACGPAIVTAAFPEKERGRAMGFIGTVVAVGLTAGPGVGGLIMSQLTWRAIFYINIPLGALGAVISYRVLGAQEHRGRRVEFDWAGGALAALWLTCLLLGIERGSTHGWSGALPVSLLAASLAAFLLFVKVESGHRAPLVDPGLFKMRIFRHGIVGAVLLFVCHFTAFFLVPFHLVKVMALPIARVGLIMTASPLVHMVVSPLAGWVYDKIGSRIPTTVGMLVSGTALLLLSKTGPHTTQLSIALKLALLGMGAAMFQPANTTAVMNSVPGERLGTASGIVAAARNLGMVLGVSAAATLFDMGYSLVAKGGGLQDFHPELMDAFTAGWKSAFVFAAGLSVVGAVIAALRGRG